MDTRNEKSQLRKVLERALLAGVASLALSFFAAKYIVQYLNADLAGRGIEAYAVSNDFSLLLEIAGDVLLLTALIGGIFVATLLVMKKRPSYPKPAVMASLAGLVAGCAGGALIGRVAFETIVNQFELPYAAGIGVSAYSLFLFKFTLLTGISSAVFVLFVTLFVTVKSRFRALYLLPSMAVLVYYYITTFPIVG